MFFGNILKILNRPRSHENSVSLKVRVGKARFSWHCDADRVQCGL